MTHPYSAFCSFVSSEENVPQCHSHQLQSFTASLDEFLLSLDVITKPDEYHDVTTAVSEVHLNELPLSDMAQSLSSDEWRGMSHGDYCNAIHVIIGIDAWIEHRQLHLHFVRFLHHTAPPQVIDLLYLLLVESVSDTMMKLINRHSLHRLPFSFPLTDTSRKR